MDTDRYHPQAESIIDILYRTEHMGTQYTKFRCDKNEIEDNSTSENNTSLRKKEKETTAANLCVKRESELRDGRTMGTVYSPTR